jgi:hypothetical protein
MRHNRNDNKSTKKAACLEIYVSDKKVLDIKLVCETDPPATSVWYTLYVCKVRQSEGPSGEANK